MTPAKKRAVKGKEKEKVPTPKQEKDGAVKGKEKEKVATPKREKDGASPVPGKPDKRHRSNTNRILGIMEADSTSEEKLQMLDPLGFRGVSRVKLTRLPDNFIEWLCKSFDVSSRSFPLLRSGKFRIGEADVERVYGLPRGPYVVKLDMFSAAQRHRWGIELGLSNTKKGKASLANVKLALEEERDNKKWRDLFVLYAMEAVLCPSGNLKINLSYAGFLQDEMVADFTQYNWCKHVADHFNDSMVEVVQSKSKFPGDVHLLFISILDRVKNPPELPIPTCKHRSYKVASAAFQVLMDEGHLNIGHRDVVMEEATSSQPMGRERVLGSKRKRPVDDLDMVREGDLPKLPHLDLNLDGVHSVEEAYQLKNDMESYKRALLRMAAHYSSSIEQVDDHIKMLEGQQPEDSPEDNVDFTDRVDDVSVAKGTNDVGRNASAANADDETGANSPKSPGLDDLSMEMDKDGAGSVDVVVPDVGHNDPAGTANDDTSPKGVLDSEGLDDHLDNLTMEMTQKSVDSENAKKVMEMDSCEEKGQGDDGDDNVDAAKLDNLVEKVVKSAMGDVCEDVVVDEKRKEADSENAKKVMEMDSCEEKGQGDDGDDNVDGVDAAKLDNLVEKVVKSAMGDVCEDVVVDEKRKEADAGEVLEGGDGRGDLTLSQLVREGKVICYTKKKFKVKNAGSSSGVDIDVLKGAVLRYARDSNNLKEILFSRVDGFDCLYRKDTETLAHGK
ncbi:unnamed protein product [Linum tenue]|uniref:Uncharacterized protein n=1 Tax=Linum tenue TaxID=586396 RepID=A0AAV0MC74_9ROSI|nr:unnamed protein product [Linum tenue]